MDNEDSMNTEIVQENVFGFDAPEEIVQDMILNVPVSQGYSDSRGLFSGRKAVMHYCQQKNISNVTINDIYLGTSVGVFHLNDQMDFWQRFDNGLPNVPVMDMEINVEEALITVGTYGRGVWQSAIEVQKAANDLVLLAVNSNNSVQCSDISPLITVKNNGVWLSNMHGN